MGGALSSFFQDGRALLSSGHNRGVSDQTRKQDCQRNFAKLSQYSEKAFHSGECLMLKGVN